MRRSVLTIVTIVLAIQSANGSYVTLNENGFDNVVVMIEEYNTNGLNCQDALDFVKVYDDHTQLKFSCINS